MGFSPPLHPVLAHMPIGLIFGALVFLVISAAFAKPALAKTARHCLVLAQAALPFVALLGIMDWQHFYKGSWLFPIKMKIGLAVALTVFLLVAIFFDSGRKDARWQGLAGNLMCAILATALGFFGRAGLRNQG
jgi:uncharacterized membrane protein